MQADCICTGCLLIEDDVAYRGDMFQMGDTYIINCNEASNHQPPEDPAGYLAVTMTGDYWTRKGVYVVKTNQATLSKALNAYVGN